MKDYKYRQILNQFRSQYYKIGQVDCPLLGGESIKFNAIGFRHFTHKIKQRPLAERLFRFSLLRFACPVIMSLDAKVSFRKVTLAERSIIFWALDKQIDNRNIRVVIRRTNNDKKIFYSIMERKSKNPPEGRVA